MESLEPLFHINLFGLKLGVNFNIIVQYLIIFLVLIISILLTRNLKKIPNKKQSVLEMFVEFINNLVKENMGSDCKNFVPYIGSLVVFLLLMNLVGLFGIEPPTKDFNVALGLAMTTFMVIQAYAIKKNGALGYFVGYAKPIPMLLPVNIMERVMLPISLSLRLFGNITAAVVIMELIYKSLGKVSWIAEIGIPIPLHFYFDIFDGTIQMLIFVMLTMINIKVIAEH